MEKLYKRKSLDRIARCGDRDATTFDYGETCNGKIKLKKDEGFDR